MAKLTVGKDSHVPVRSITLDPKSGSTIEEVCDYALTLAQLTCVRVIVPFEGDTIWAEEGDQVGDLVAAYWERVHLRNRNRKQS